MPLVINDPETIAAIERLAAERGTTEEDVVVQMVAEKHAPAPHETGFDDDLYAKIMEISRRAAATVPDDQRHDNHSELLFDEHGLPNRCPVTDRSRLTAARRRAQS